MPADEIARLNAALEGRYRIERKLGEGGMATVYRARDLRHERDVALKVLRAELAARVGPERFLREIRITANLRHPHILPLFDSGEAGGFLYYVMPLVEGGSLKDLITRTGALQIADAARILRDVVDALASAHEHGVVHRDLKPANILLDGRHASVADFGIAKAVRDSSAEGQLTTAGTSLGTPAYMSPEQAAGDEAVDHRSDVYAVGAMAYELLAGRPPFDRGTGRKVMLAHVTQAPDPVARHRSDLPPDLAEAVMRCLAKDPEDRWQRIDEMLPALEAAAVETTATGGAKRRGTPTAPSRRRTPALAAGAVVVATLLFVAREAWYPSGEAGAGGSEASRAADARSGPRLAIEPLVNASGDPELDWVSARTVEAMRRAVGQHAPAVTVVDPATADADGGATHVIRGRFLVDPVGTTVTLDVLEGTGGDPLRTLEPIVGPMGTVDEVISAAGDAAAVVAMMVQDNGGDPFYLRYWPLPRSPVALRLQQTGNRAFREGRNADAISWFRQAIEEEPDWPTPYTTLRPALMNAGRVEEWGPFERALDSIRSRMTEDQHDFWTWLTAPRIADQITAGERRLARHGGIQNLGYSVALVAILAGRLELARAAMDEQDREQGMVRNWPPMWRLDALIAHLEGDYAAELRIARDGLGRFPENAQLIEAEARALLALDSIGGAVERFSILAQKPGDRETLWHVLHDVALEAGRHGHEPESRALFEDLVGWSEEQELGWIRRGAALYGAGRLDEAVAVLGPSFSVEGAWTGPADTAWEERSEAAALLVLSLERLGRGEEAARVGPILGDFPSGSRSPGRRWPALVDIGLGQVARGFRRLDEAFADQMPMYELGRRPDESLFLHNRPELTPVRETEGFRQLIAPR